MLATFQMSFFGFFFSIVSFSSFINDISMCSESLLRVATLVLNRTRRTVATGAISEKLQGDVSFTSQGQNGQFGPI